MNLAYAAAAVAALAFAAPASAATVSFIGFVQNGDSYTNIAPDAQSGDVDVNVTGSSDGLYADIYAGTDVAGTPYNSVRTGGSLTYNLTGVAGSIFRFIWGTVDDYNTLTINNTGGGTEVIGGELIKTLAGGVAQGVANVIVEIKADSAFKSVTLTSSGNSFEHAFNPPELAPVPVPAAGLLLVAALGGLGVAARRRKSA
jgi:hypothetical protein